MTETKIYTTGDKKYYGYQEMLFMHRPQTVSRKKPLGSLVCKDGLQVDIYDFYNKFFFFTKFPHSEKLVNIRYDDCAPKTSFEEMKERYQNAFSQIDRAHVDAFIREVANNEVKQKSFVPEFVEFCKDYDFFIEETKKNEDTGCPVADVINEMIADTPSDEEQEKTKKKVKNIHKPKKEKSSKKSKASKSKKKAKKTQ